MRMKVLVAAMLFMAVPGFAMGQQAYVDPVPSMDGAIKGTMKIDFGTRLGRSADNATPLGAVDTYATDIEVFNSVLLQGDIERRPWIPTSVLGRTKQQGYLAFDLRTTLRNPANPTQTRTLGSWIGAMMMDGNGVYTLDTPPEGKGELRISADAVGRIPAFTSNFGGVIQGRIPAQAGIAGLIDRTSRYVTKTYTRVVNGQTVSKTVEGADPMEFQNVVMAMGPLAGYPETRTNGNIDYDPEEGIWYVDVSASYSSDGISFNDRYSGTIRWIEDANREANGLGYYEINVRLNEAAATAADAFAPVGAAAEDAFFATDVSIPGFTGRVSYKDSYVGESVTRSEVAYAINASAASRIQSMNFAKMLLLIIGPFNDE